MPATARTKLRDNLRSVQDRIGQACERAGRHPSDVVLVAVTKTVSADLAGLLPELGILDLGEGRPQELWSKSAVLRSDIRWHLIGHLQSNKIEKTLPLVNLIHSVDSLRVLQALEKEAQKQQREMDVLLEINVAMEKTKKGFAPADLDKLVEPIQTLQMVRVQGLMTMAPLQDAEKCRAVFVGLRESRDRLQAQLSEPHALLELSMGMSNDFEVAVEEGATMVRLGTVLWEGVV